MQRSGERVHGGGEGEVGIGEGRSDEVAGVRRGVSALVVRVDGDVQPHKLVEAFVARKLITEHVAKVGGVVEAGVVLIHLGPRPSPLWVVGAAEDQCADLRHPGEEVHHVFVHVVPVESLVGPFRVLLREDRLRLQSEDRRRELGHRVHPLGEGANHPLHVSRKLRARVQLRRHRVGLLLGGHLARQQEPQHALRYRLLFGDAPDARFRRELLLQLGDGQPAEADALHRVELRRLPQHALD
mmetsp:Transcript_49254/g.159651  ORF Transcript_49254/g.159651 Transcript_49254/m.159651 type:complete len:241 (-) Transcript_49254:297-1019(-)